MSSYPGDPRKRNAAYGGGVYRRRIAISAGPGEVLAEMEDNQHGFRLRLKHDASAVTELEAETRRFPFSTCPGATEPLRALVGTALSVDAGGLRKVIPPGSNCTHLYDLATLALAHWQRGIEQRIYDVEVPDERRGITVARVALDGAIVHDWQIREHRLLVPQALASVSILGGFYQRAAQLFDADQLEAAQVLQRGYFVAQARRFDFANSVGAPASDDNMAQGSCYTYNHGVVEQAVRTGTTREFSDSAARLLQFD